MMNGIHGDRLGAACKSEVLFADDPSVSTGVGEDDMSNCSDYSDSFNTRGSAIGERPSFLSISPGNIHDFYDINEAELDDLSYRSVSVASPKQSPLLPARCVKAISKSQAPYFENLYSEVAITQLFDHENVMGRYECFEDETFIYLVTEMCDGGELFERVAEHGPLAEHEAAVVMQQLIRAVSHIHERGVVHRDLTCENVFLQAQGPIEETLVKVTGFERASSKRTFEPGLRAGSSEYAAPEVHSGYCGAASDLWSCGCIMFVLLGGYHPFAGHDDNAKISKIKKGSYAFKGEPWRRVSQDAKDLIQMLLKIDPSERLTADQALSQAWLSGVARTASI